MPESATTPGGARSYAAGAAVAFVMLFAVPVALHLVLFPVQAFTGMATMPDLGELLGGNALWAAAWTLLGLLPLAYGLDRWAPARARSWWPVLGLAAVAFAVAWVRLTLTFGLGDLAWALAEAVLVVMGFLVLQAVAARMR